MNNDKERQKAIRFIDNKISEVRKRKQKRKMICVAMRIHEDDMPGFTEMMFKAAEHIRLMSN
jgi:hypothetical protein